MNITIKNIQTRPELDPYHRDTNQPTKTALYFDPRDNTVWVQQDWDSNSIPMDLYHKLYFSWHVPDYPFEQDMRDAIENDLMPLFERVAAGFDEVWDGSNMVGRLNEDARHAALQIEDYLNDGFFNGWDWAIADDWLYEFAHNEVAANTTDEQIAQMALDVEVDELAEHRILFGDIEAFLKQMRDDMRDTE